ncbi:MAG: helix-turn-helix transcriptional regulator [Cyanobacteria bacterium P01_F01_bin.143]|uniref:helix-turn-helix domain-containing protein n=1 Tax=Xenococcus sp. PCC 7305 TaxID=102125 RepID=UPI0005936A61|nr:helix-turn-helix transcriptional regulator [Xenococcus sp. PCC 7305]
MLRWRLKEIMARYDISNIDLAKELDMRPASISHLRNSKTIPSIGGDRLTKLCSALSKLAGKKIHFAELYEEETITA